MTLLSGAWRLRPMDLQLGRHKVCEELRIGNRLTITDNEEKTPHRPRPQRAPRAVLVRRTRTPKEWHSRTMDEDDGRGRLRLNAPDSLCRPAICLSQSVPIPIALPRPLSATHYWVRFYFVASHQEFRIQESAFRIDSQQLTPEIASRLDVLNQEDMNNARITVITCWYVTPEF